MIRLRKSPEVEIHLELIWEAAIHSRQKKARIQDAILFAKCFSVKQTG